MATRKKKTEEEVVETTEIKDEGTKVESKDVLPDSLSTEIKGESTGPEFKVKNTGKGTVTKSKSMKVIRN